MKKILQRVVLLIVLVAIGYYYRGPLSALWGRVLRIVQPCSAPLAYSIGRFDTQFGISKQDFLSALAVAEAIWEKPTGKDLFMATPDGELKINLVYDYRQQATQKLQTIGVVVENTRSSYDAMRAKYRALTAKYETDKISFESRLTLFEQRSEEYSRTVAQWNRKGGAPKSTYEQLQSEQRSLQVEREELMRLQAALNESVAEINALVVSMNQVAANLNLNVEKYNEVGASRGEEFTEGVYRSSALGDEIDIYQYDNRSKLIRVLAHELGHALGLPHVEDSKAIMYRLNAGVNEKLTAADTAAVTSLCGEE